MVRKFAVPLLCAAVAFPGLVRAGSDDALELLARASQAARRLNYIGTFETDAGEERHELSQIFHMFDQGHEREKLVKMLARSPHEIIRHDDEAICYAPGEREIRKGRARTRRSFPAVLPDSVEGLADAYVPRIEPVMERIAGFDCRVVNLRPRDNLRFARQYCIEPASGMLLRATVLNEGRVLEQSRFTQLALDVHIRPVDLQPSYATHGWNTLEISSGASLTGWSVSSVPPGFHKIREYRRDAGRTGPVLQLVYSDGVAAVSIFIERELSPPGLFPDRPPGSEGSVSMFERRVSDNKVTVVGEVPVETVSRMGLAVVPMQ